MNKQPNLSAWDTFKAVNRHRRAIRKFSSTPIPEEDISAVLDEAMLAPSSGNLHPYQLHWVRDPELKARVAEACKGQKAAVTAGDIIVVVASTKVAKQTAIAQLDYVESSELGENSKAYHRKQMGMFLKVLKFGSLALWSPLVFLTALIRPSLSLLPVGPIGGRHWAARNAIFAVQTLMLAAAAKGIDSCPMEGFSAAKLAELLDLPRGAVIPVVVALGYRANDARIEAQWRRPVSEIVVRHYRSMESKIDRRCPL